MRVLLDEMMPRKLKAYFSEDAQTVTVRERGWDSLDNGELLEAAAHEFDAVVTTDQGIPHQQNLSRFDLTIIVLEAKSNRLSDLRLLMEEVNEALERSAHRPNLIRIPC